MLSCKHHISMPHITTSKSYLHRSLRVQNQQYCNPKYVIWDHEDGNTNHNIKHALFIVILDRILQNWEREKEECVRDGWV